MIRDTQRDNRTERNGTKCQPVVEALEARQLLAASVAATIEADGLLNIQGTKKSDVLMLRTSGKPGRLFVKLNGRQKAFLVSKVDRIAFTAANGNDRVKISSKKGGVSIPLFIDGGAGNDLLVGSTKRDRLIGGAGNDRLDGGGSHDLMDGGDGNDTLIGGKGNDRITGGEGDDRLDDTSGKDKLDGGPGRDTVNGVLEAGTNPNPNPDPDPDPNPNPNPNPDPDPDPDPDPNPNPPPQGNSSFKPDLAIRARYEETYVGTGIINADAKSQGVSQQGNLYPLLYEYKLTNAGTKPDRFRITGPDDSDGWGIRYYDSIVTGFKGGQDISADVKSNSGWLTPVVEPGQSIEFRLEVRPTAKVRGGSINRHILKAASNNDPDRFDTARATSDEMDRAIPEIRRRNFDASGLYRMSITNEGNITDSFLVKAPRSGDGWTARYFDAEFGGNDITAAVAGAGWETPRMLPKRGTGFRVEFNRDNKDVMASVRLTAASTSHASKVDFAQISTRNPVDPPPFFVIGAWSQPTYNFDKWKARGINTLVKYEGLSGTVSLDEWNRQAKAKGFYMIREWRQDPAQDIGEERLLAWMHADEPDINGNHRRNNVPDFNRLREIDPNRPITGNYAGSHVLEWHPLNFPRKEYDPLNAARDWGMQGVYPVNGWGRPEDFDAPGRATDRLEKMMEGKPQITVIESGDQELPWMPQSLRPATAGEFRAEMWDSVIRGARGIVYFPFLFMNRFKFDSTTDEIDAEMRVQHERLKDMSDVLMKPIDPPAIGMEVESPLITSWRLVNGKAYYFVLNLSDKPVRAARMQLHGIARDGTASVRGEKRTLAISDRAMVDDFGAFETHIYEMDGPAAAGSRPRLFSTERI